jgi:DNA-binding IclR family transcriptional regulator
MSLSELARSLKLRPSTVHNIVKTLRLRGYVHQEANGARYRLGLRCYELARGVMLGRNLPELARPFLQKLATEVDETVVLSVLEQSEVYFIAHVLSQQMLAVTYNRTWMKDGYNTASGRALLAFSESDVVDRYVAAHPLPGTTQSELRRREDLDRELAKARREGYAMLRREGATAICAVAAPIRDFSGKVIAGVGLSLPALRFHGDHRKKIIHSLLRTAEEISRQLGGAPRLQGANP